MLLLLLALAQAPATAATSQPTPTEQTQPMTCSTRGGAARLGYGIAAVLVLGAAMGRRKSKKSEPLSDEQRKKFRDL